MSRATGVDPYYVGKPNPLMMRSALNAIEAHSETTAMIGDRMDTDVVAGLEAGLETILVLTGVTHARRAERYSYRPSRIVDRWPISSPSWTATVAELDGKVALVTGASGGIGAAVARSLHEAGASVGLLSRRGEDLGLERALGDRLRRPRPGRGRAGHRAGGGALRPARHRRRERGSGLLRARSSSSTPTTSRR